MSYKMDDEFMRIAVQHLKQTFTRWRDPPVELPAESVIYQALSEIFELYETQKRRSESVTDPR
jgi:hypothetical protein